jgi:hypothetical protein
MIRAVPHTPRFGSIKELGGLTSIATTVAVESDFVQSGSDRITQTKKIKLGMCESSSDS